MLLLLKTTLKLRDCFLKVLLKLILLAKLVFELSVCDVAVLSFNASPFSFSEKVEDSALLFDSDKFNLGAKTICVVGFILYSNSKLTLFPVFSFLVLESASVKIFPVGNKLSWFDLLSFLVTALVKL
ncbi:hypothetical protein D3C80_1820230 [compost metagenome]